MKNWLKILLIILSFSNQLGAINYDLIKCDQYTIENGLPQSFIENIYQDSNGYLWIATQDGISKFNGYEFNNYFFDPFNPQSLGSNYALEIKAWNTDTLLFTTSLGVSLLNLKTEEFKNYGLTKIKTELGSITSCAILSKRNILIGTTRGLYTAKLTDTLTEVGIRAVDASLQVRTIKHFNGETFIISDSTLYKYVDKKLTVVHTYPSTILNVFADDKKLCVSLDKQFLIFKDVLDEPEIIDVPAAVTSFLQVGEEMWLGTNGQGVIIYNTALAQPIQWLRNQGTKSNLLSENIKCIYKDNFGIIWLGSDKGLNKIDPSKQQFLHFNAASFSQESNNNSWSFYENDSLFFSGYSNGIQIQNKKAHTFSWLPFDGYIFDVEEFHGKLLMGTSKGIYSLTQEDGGHIIHPTSLKLDSTKKTPEITFDLEEMKGHLFVGSINGIGIYDTTFTLINYIKQSNVRDFEETDGSIYFTGTPTSIYKITNTSDLYFASYSTQKIDQVSQLLSLCLTSVGDDLWLGLYGGGLIRYNKSTKESVHYSTKNGLPNNSVYSIIPDDAGFLWMSTNGGLSKFDIKNERFYNYNTNDGVQSLEFNAGSYFKSKSGKIYFGGINGYNIVNPNEQNKNSVAPKIIISSLTYDDKNLLSTNNGVLSRDEKNRIVVTIPHYKNSFTIKVDGLHYSAPTENAYSYMLEGYESSPIIVKNKREFFYNNLQAGDYFFKVKVANSDGLWSREEKIIHIIIKPPFYLTWWFITAASALTAFLIFITVYSRVTMAKRQRLVLERKVRERTREVEKQKSILEEQKDLIEAEKNKEEELLLNVLPRETARELISTGRSTPKHYEMATVMFADFKNFTKITENLGPKELVAELDDSFARFDDIVGRFNIEKIKTSGDAYMCVGGVPIRNRTNAVDCVLAAFKFQKYMEEKRNIRDGTGKPQWHLRIGLHTGELVAGVVGKKKFLYDVWGDTVNTAARMETSSDPGRVNISGTTYEFVKDYFDCEFRGKLPVKNKGAIDMYYVTGIKPELSEDKEGIIPNKRFFELLNFKVYSQQNYNKVKDVVINKLKQELPNNLYYHGPHHTLDVMESAERIGRSEGLSEEEILLVKLAALFHDSGFLNKYRNNEIEGAKFAKEFLPKYGFTDQQVDLVEGMILATQIPQKPTNLLEEIICDADLDYLGRSKEEFEEISNRLAKELVEYKFLKSTDDWDPIQVKFLENHSYFTKTCNDERRSGKTERLREIRDRLIGPTG